MEIAKNDFTNGCSAMRTQIKSIGVVVLDLKAMACRNEPGEGKDTGEMIANVTLAYRHLEDAAMRLGKAIQAYETGNSIYDQNDSLRAAGKTE